MQWSLPKTAYAMRRCFTISICRKCGQRRYVQLNSVINDGVWSHNDRSPWERPNACWRSSPLPAPVVKNQELPTASPTTRKEQDNILLFPYTRRTLANLCGENFPHPGYAKPVAGRTAARVERSTTNRSKRPGPSGQNKSV